MFKSTISLPAGISPIKLKSSPPFLNEIFTLLKSSGAEHFALFGGAARDADYAAYHNKEVKIKDYDLRVWLPLHVDAEAQKEFILQLAFNAKTVIHQVPSAGTQRIRYCLTFNDVELDISIRPVPVEYHYKKIPSHAVAINRALDSDIALSSIAIDSSGCAWARREYADDLQNKTLTIFPSDNKKRIEEYAERMREKFPDHMCVYINDEKSELLKLVK